MALGLQTDQKCKACRKHVGWPPVISTLSGLSSLLSLQGVEVTGLQGKSRAGLLRAITHPGLSTLSPF